MPSFPRMVPKNLQKMGADQKYFLGFQSMLMVTQVSEIKRF